VPRRAGKPPVGPVAGPGDLRRIPGVGPSIAATLVALGYRRVEDLRGADPEAMYRRLCEIRGARVDPCVLYVFRLAVYYAATPDPDPALLRWWIWKTPAPAGGGAAVGGRGTATLRSHR
jgi:hypothetical protein